jgi:hypothetical protein
MTIGSEMPSLRGYRLRVVVEYTQTDAQKLFVVLRGTVSKGYICNMSTGSVLYNHAKTSQKNLKSLANWVIATRL